MKPSEHSAKQIKSMMKIQGTINIAFEIYTSKQTFFIQDEMIIDFTSQAIMSLQTETMPFT